MLSVGDLDLVATFSEPSLGCSDVSIVVFSGSDSFSRIWSQREREGGGGGGSDFELNLPLA